MPMTCLLRVKAARVPLLKRSAVQLQAGMNSHHLVTRVRPLKQTSQISQPYVGSMTILLVISRVCEVERRKIDLHIIVRESFG
jgi:hypothetical protein